MTDERFAFGWKRRTTVVRDWELSELEHRFADLPTWLHVDEHDRVVGHEEIPEWLENNIAKGITTWTGTQLTPRDQDTFRYPTMNGSVERDLKRIHKNGREMAFLKQAVEDGAVLTPTG